MKLEEFVTKICNEKNDLNQKNAESTIDFLEGMDPTLNSKILEETFEVAKNMSNYLS